LKICFQLFSLYAINIIFHILTFVYELNKNDENLPIATYVSFIGVHAALCTLKSILIYFIIWRKRKAFIFQKEHVSLNTPERDRGHQHAHNNNWSHTLWGLLLSFLFVGIIETSPGFAPNLRKSLNNSCFFLVWIGFMLGKNYMLLLSFAFSHSQRILTFLVVTPYMLLRFFFSETVEEYRIAFLVVIAILCFCFLESFFVTYLDARKNIKHILPPEIRLDQSSKNSQELESNQHVHAPEEINLGTSAINIFALQSMDPSNQAKFPLNNSSKNYKGANPQISNYNHIGLSSMGYMPPNSNSIRSSNINNPKPFEPRNNDNLKIKDFFKFFFDTLDIGALLIDIDGVVITHNNLLQDIVTKRLQGSEDNIFESISRLRNKKFKKYEGKKA
jgi:hypothetical protein